MIITLLAREKRNKFSNTLLVGMAIGRTFLNAN